MAALLSRRHLLGALALGRGTGLWPVALATPDPDGSGDGSEARSGDFLIATPDMPDPRFARSVILMVQHDRSGAFGLIINHPLGRRPIAGLLAAAGEPAEGVAGEVMLYVGGPVEPELGFVLHTPDYHRSATLAIDANVAMTASLDVLRDIGRGRGPAKSLVIFGYSGWGPGQLESEMMRGSWYTSPESPDLVFDVDRAKVWDTALRRRSIPL
jgi:putative transcriptional regulator